MDEFIKTFFTKFKVLNVMTLLQNSKPKFFKVHLQQHLHFPLWRKHQHVKFCAVALILGDYPTHHSFTCVQYDNFWPKPVAFTHITFYFWWCFPIQIKMILNGFLQGLHFWFDTGLNSPSLKSACPNCLSAFKQPKIIHKYIEDEINFQTIRL